MIHQIAGVIPVRRLEKGQSTDHQHAKELVPELFAVVAKVHQEAG